MGFYLLTKPTRIADNSATVLDQTWTNIQLRSSNAYILIYLLADHMECILKKSKPECSL